MSEPPHRRWAHGEEIALCAAIAVNVLVALTAVHFPYQDAVNHLARYFLIDQVWSGRPVDWVQIRLVPTSYIGTDLFGIALVHFLGVAAALRVMAVLPLLLLPA